MPNKPIEKLSDLLTADSLKLLASSGKDFVKEVGYDIVRGVILDVMSGRNLRDSTESITRRRIASINLATVNLFLKGSSLSSDFISQLPILATNILKKRKLEKSEKILAQWALGLNGKAIQNILRSNPKYLDTYRDRYIETCKSVIQNHTKSYGELSGSLQINAGAKAEINWLFMTYLLSTVGSQTLAIRGADKSAFGKLFEKLILGSLLQILGFKKVSFPPKEVANVFWLSLREEKRESDATLLYKEGQGARFDIGFIGPGNTEISLDKVSRFEREITLGRAKYYLATIILVDRIGKKSRIEDLAKQIEGTIIQMSASYWPKTVAQTLNKAMGYKHPLLEMDDSKIDAYLRTELSKISLETLVEGDIQLELDDTALEDADTGAEA